MQTQVKSREKILAKPADLFHARGFNHTSIQVILEAASVNTSNFHYHFESKEQLGLEALVLRMGRFYLLVIEPSLVKIEPELIRRNFEMLHAFIDGRRGP